MTNEKGFTLVELMVVIAIIGILATLVIPKFSASTAAAQDAKLKADLRTIDGSIMQYYATNSKYPLTTADLYSASNTTYLASWPKDSKDVELDYVYVAATGTAAEYYTLSGSDSKSASHKSPGSKDYVAW